MIRSFFIILSLVTFSLASYGGTECKAMRLDAPGGPMEKMPVLNQRDFGYCFATTTSMAVDAYRFSHGDKNFDHITSPFVIAQKHRVLNQEAASFFRDELEWNKKKDLKKRPDDPVKRTEESESLALQLSIHLNQTPMSIFPVNPKPKAPPLVYPNSDYRALSSASEYLDAGWASWAYQANTGLDGQFTSCDNASIKKLARSRKDLQTLIDLWTLSKNNPIKYAQEKEICALKSRDYARFAKSVDMAAKETNLQDYLNKFVSEACNDKSIKVALPVPTLVQDSETKKMSESLKAALNLKNPQPPAMAYCAKYYISKVTSHIPYESCDAPHGSAVIGMRPSENGKCEFLIRNSWGEECIDSYPKEKCENGQYWVDEDTMNNTAYSFTLLLDKDQEEQFKSDKSWQKKKKTRWFASGFLKSSFDFSN